MSSRHAVGYSKSIRARCKSTSCRNTALPVGTLRYGKAVATELGETVEWRHWACVTPDILEQLAIAKADNIAGFGDLRSEDQQKIRLAISLRRIDPSDSSARQTPTDLNTSQNSVNRSKRKGDEDMPNPVEFEDEEEPIEEEVTDEIYCRMTTNVVGIQYYKGLVGPGEQVLLVREPQNPYDRNAIQVKNIGQTQVGHLPRNVVGKLAPLLDQRSVSVDGVINDGNLSGSRGYTLSITLSIFGPSDKRDQLEPALIWATPGQRGFPSRKGKTKPSVVTSGQIETTTVPGPNSSSRALKQTAAQTGAVRRQQEALQKAAELKQMLNNLEKVDDEGRRSSLLDTLCSTEDVLSLPVYPNPPGLKSGDLTVDLLKHQSQALQWCMEREYPVLPKKETDRPVQFWQLRKNGSKPYYYNIATKTPQETQPLLGRGALCADAMGLGKTLTMIALVLATKGDVPPDFSKATLIVAPLSVLSNWEKQIRDHCSPGALKTCVYYGATRSLSPSELQEYDIVITTYQTVAGEHAYSHPEAGNKKKKVQRSLFDIRWKRVILDEGHTIRNPKTKMAKAVVALSGERRWVLSGTPIINSPRDLGSILTFLQICRPLDNEDFYKRLLLRPLKNGEASGVELLRALMSHICIRRTKEMQDSEGNPLIPLPPVEMIKVPVTLNDDARRLYDEVEEVSKQRFANFLNRGVNTMVQSNVLSMLTRMRQLALHPGLVPANYLEELRAAEPLGDAPAKVTSITSQDKLRLQGLLAQGIEDCQECPICFGVLDEGQITLCAHMFCLACIREVISRDPKCPMDRRPLTLEDLLPPLPPTDLTQGPLRVEGDIPTGVRAGSSAKIDQLIHLLKLTPRTEKSLVFSQFTSFLDKVAEEMEKAGIQFVRFDGQMSAKRRQETIARFSVPLDDGIPVSGSQTLSISRSHRGIHSTCIDDESIPDQQDDDDFVMRAADDDLMDEDDGGNHSSRKTRRKDKSSVNINRNAQTKHFNSENPKVMLISLKAGALGLNLTVANNVYLMDPWWQEGIESQAVDRVNRIGQTKPVHVYQLIADNTVESKVLEIQERKKQLIQQAFSGIKRTETQRQQREARLQDLVELFGLRHQSPT